MKAIVLAAGKGVRMLPLTAEKPKVLVEVAGKPFLWYVLNNLVKAGFTDMGLIVGYKKERVIEFIEKYKSHWPKASFSFLEQKEQLGTGHATLCAKSFVHGKIFLSINGDNLYPISDLRKLKKIKKTTICAIKIENPSAYGILETDGNKLVRIHEKPKIPPTNLINTAAYIFTPEIFDILKKVKKSARGEYEVTDAINILAQQREVFVYELEFWKDFGKLEDIPLLEKFLKEMKL